MVNNLTHFSNLDGCIANQQIDNHKTANPKLLFELSNHFTVYHATEEDLIQIVAIYNQSIAGKQATADLQPVTPAQRQAWFNQHHPASHPIYVVKDRQGNMAAWGSFSHLYQRPAYHISSEISIYVADEYQRQGIARQLLSWMLQQALSLGICNVVALIFAHNQPSIRLFQDLGFEQWGRLPQICDMDGFYADVLMLGKQI